MLKNIRIKWGRFNLNKTVAVVVTYNRRELLKKCIEGIRGQKDATCDIIVIDNHSTDGTGDMLLPLIDAGVIQYYLMDSNLGCAEGTMRGMEIAVKKGYQYIWIMDDDVFPHDNTLAILLEKDKKLHGDWGMLSSIAYWTDGSLCKANIQKKGVFSFLKKSDYKKELVPIKMSSLASMFIKSDVIKDVGLLIGEYGIYTEDYEFTNRVAKKYPMYAVPASKVTHAMKVNMKVNIAKDSPDRMYRYECLYRNDVHCYKQYGVIGYLYLLLKFVHAILLIALVAQDNKRGRIKMVANGYREGFKFNPVIRKVD